MTTTGTETTAPHDASTEGAVHGNHEPRIAPPPDAPFADKLAYYKTQHTSRGVRASHLVGIPTVLSSLPLLFARPRIGVTMFAAGWAIQLAGHKFFEHNKTALRDGPITYQLTGVAFWCEEVGNMLAAAARRTPGRGVQDGGLQAGDR